MPKVALTPEQISLGQTLDKAGGEIMQILETHMSMLGKLMQTTNDQAVVDEISDRFPNVAVFTILFAMAVGGETDDEDEGDYDFEDDPDPAVIGFVEGLRKRFRL